jgi:hypothetical protein
MVSTAEDGTITIMGPCPTDQLLGTDSIHEVALRSGLQTAPHNYGSFPITAVRRFWKLTVPHQKPPGSAVAVGEKCTDSDAKTVLWP